MTARHVPEEELRDMERRSKTYLEQAFPDDGCAASAADLAENTEALTDDVAALIADLRAERAHRRVLGASLDFHKHKAGCEQCRMAEFYVPPVLSLCHEGSVLKERWSIVMSEFHTVAYPSEEPKGAAS